MPRPKPTWELIQPEVQRIMRAIKRRPARPSLRRDLEQLLSPFAIKADRVPAKKP